MLFGRGLVGRRTTGAHEGLQALAAWVFGVDDVAKPTGDRTKAWGFGPGGQEAHGAGGGVSRANAFGHVGSGAHLGGLGHVHRRLVTAAAVIDDS